MLGFGWVHAASLAVGLVLITGSAGAAERPCDRLFVPEGYELTCTMERLPGDDAWEVSVHPTDGTFASLSELTLTPVKDDILDPVDWLRKQVRIDVTGLEGALTSFLDDDDNPLPGKAGGRRCRD